MRIAVDAMGSDNCPVPDVTGAVMAASENNLGIILVGDAGRIRHALDSHRVNGLPIEICHRPQAGTMSDRPAVASKGKPDSSMHVGMRMVRDGQADAFVSMGNTGAALTIATLFTLRRITGVKRPAVSGIFPIGNKIVILLDIGANTNSRPEWLLQFALMGQIYAQNVLNIPDPHVGLISNGEEEGKGDVLVRQTDPLLRNSGLNYVGNIEPKDVFGGLVDVVISDGFLGNMLVKTFESTSRYVTRLIHEEIRSDPLSLLAGAILQPAFRRVRRRADTFEVGGAPLLGVNGVVIIGHGRSNARAVSNAIRQAARAVEGNVIEAIKSGVQTYPVG
ncbi:MAG: phosphate acyltransferase PlsX [Anaerolineaceae bacterium]|nr:phosphate acyltransferase PlsX [Anaerolineaceae bacterium]